MFCARSLAQSNPVESDPIESNQTPVLLSCHRGWAELSVMFSHRQAKSFSSFHEQLAGIPVGRLVLLSGSALLLSLARST